MVHTNLNFPDWLKAVASKIKESRRHKDLYIDTATAKEVYNLDVHPHTGATLILRILKPESNLQNCLYLREDIGREFGDLIYHSN